MKKLIPMLVILFFVLLAGVAYQMFFASSGGPLPSTSRPETKAPLPPPFQVVNTQQPPLGVTNTSTVPAPLPSVATEETTITPPEILVNALETLPSAKPPSVSDVPPENGAPEYGESALSQDLFIIESPLPNSHVTSPILISGKAKTSGKIFFRITTLSGAVLIQESADLKGALDAAGFRPYRIRIGYDFSTTREGYVEVTIQRASGGTESMRVKVFFD